MRPSGELMPNHWTIYIPDKESNGQPRVSEVREPSNRHVLQNSECSFVDTSIKKHQKIKNSTVTLLVDWQFLMTTRKILEASTLFNHLHR